jgi:hypothetical protein
MCSICITIESEGVVLLRVLAAEWMGAYREAVAFGVTQGQPAAAELGFENTVLFLQASDDLLLVAIDPASEHDNQDVQEHTRSSS